MKYFNGMLGLGDNFYQRAVVRELGECHLVTSWPQLYAGLPVHCVRPQTRLRTQAKNAKREGVKWADEPMGVSWRRLAYDGSGSMLGSLFNSVGIQPATVNFDGPLVKTSSRKPYIVIRPGTIRGEWLAAARNPDPQALVEIADALKDDFHIISIADLDGVNEYAVEPLPFAHEVYHSGELTIDEILPLIAGASGVVGGVGWLLPASIAYHVPMMLVYGGWGHVNGPQHTLDSRMDTTNLVQVFPDKFCMCNNRYHDCDKRISNLDEHIGRFRIQISLSQSLTVVA